MIMVIGPTKKKAEAKAEQRRKREGDVAAAAASNDAPATGTTAQAPVDPATEAALDTSVETETTIAE
jgi:translation initiation factor IF-3